MSPETADQLLEMAFEAFGPGEDAEVLALGLVPSLEDPRLELGPSSCSRPGNLGSQTVEPRELGLSSCSRPPSPSGSRPVPLESGQSSCSRPADSSCHLSVPCRAKRRQRRVWLFQSKRGAVSLWRISMTVFEEGRCPVAGGVPCGF